MVYSNVNVLSIESSDDILKDSDDKESDDKESNESMYLWTDVIVSYDNCKQDHNYYKNGIL